MTLGGVRLDVRRERSLSDLSEYQEFGLEDAVASALSAPGAPRASEQTEPSPTSSARANVWEVSRTIQKWTLGPLLSLMPVKFVIQTFKC